MKPSIGRIVHYVHDGIHHAAIITRVCLPPLDECDAVELTVFPSTAASNSDIKRVTLAPYDERVPVEGTWHWPEREA